MMRRTGIGATLFGLAAMLALSAACGDTGGGDGGGATCELTRPEPGEAFDELSDYCFFRGKTAQQDLKPSEGVEPFDVRSKLYSDKSDKFRFIVLPEGGKIDYDDQKMWSFPDGTIIVKTFYYPHDARKPDQGRRLLETRLLIKHDGEWEPEVYLWNDEQTRAKRHKLGEDRTVKWIDEQGDEVTTSYRVPDVNKCKSCHMENNDIALLGPRTRQLNRPREYAEAGSQNQLEHMAEQGMFDEAPSGDFDKLPKLADPKDESLSLEKRARAYLEGNCAHCHNPTGGASNSGLDLTLGQDDPYEYGVCKQTVAAGGGTGGLKFDIKPGHPDESIMVFRMESNDPEIKMPELPLRTVDQFGVDLISKWIAEMEAGSCDQMMGN